MAHAKVVHIEMNPEVTDLVRFILGHKKILPILGYENIEVIGETSGRVGLETVRRVRPDLILLGLIFFDMGGEQVNQELKADEELRDIPVIVVSDMKPRHVLLERLGPVDDYITKPFGPQELLASVAQVLQDRRDQANLDLTGFQNLSGL